MADTIAFILIEIASGEEYKFVKDVRELKEVTEAYIVYGAWDIIVRVQTNTMGELNSVVLKIRKIKANVKKIYFFPLFSKNTFKRNGLLECWKNFFSSIIPSFQHSIIPSFH